jgi:hypothetical protein
MRGVGIILVGFVFIGPGSLRCDLGSTIARGFGFSSTTLDAGVGLRV